MRHTISLLLIGGLTSSLEAQVAPAFGKPLEAEALGVVRSFFAYDTAPPLNARVTEDQKTPVYRRERIVFTGADGSRVPALLTIPLNTAGPVPLVVQIHAGASTKESWWRPDGIERGRLITDQLLAEKVALLALDAQFHGERAAANDFEPFARMWFDGKESNWLRGGIVQTVRDYRRALDYVSTRPEIDMSRVGVIGYSLGGMMSIYLTAFDRRVRATVACVAGVDEPWLRPITPMNVASALGGSQMLLVAGSKDPLATPQKVSALYEAILSNQKHLVTFDAGHNLPPAYADSAATWLLARLR